MYSLAYLLRLLWGILWLWALCSAATAQVRPSADDVLRLTYTYAARHQLSLGAFQAEVYTRTRIETQRRNNLMRFVPGLFDIERGTNVYISESYKRYRYHYPSMIDQKVLASYGTLTQRYDLRSQILSSFNISTYGSCLWSERVLSPFHSRNKAYYHYQLDSIYTQGEHTWCSIVITPRTPNTQLVQGVALIDLYTGRVRQFSVRGRYDLFEIYVTAVLGESGLASLLPQEVYVQYYLNLLGNRINTSFFSFIVPTKLQTRDAQLYQDSLHHHLPAPYDKTSAYILATDTTAMRTDLAFFDSIRPVPLTIEEQQRYRLYTHQQNVASTQPTNVIHTPRLVQQLNEIVLSSHAIRFQQKGSFHIPPLLSPAMFRWSHTRGLYLQTKFALDYTPHSRFTLGAYPKVGYNVKENEWYGALPLTCRLWPEKNMEIKIELAKQANIYSSEQLEILRERIHGIHQQDTLTQMVQPTHLQYYRNYIADFSLTFEPIHGLTVGTHWTYQYRNMAHWQAAYAHFKLLRYINTVSSQFVLTWTPGYTYYIAQGRKVKLSSRWPTFMCSYQRSFQGHHLKTDFERIEFNISHWQKLYALKSLYFRLGGGFYTHLRNARFVSYDLFNDNEPFTPLSDEMMGRFQLLDARWYNQSPYYALGTIAYESPMLLLTRIASFSRYVQKERLYANTLFVNALKPYIELGYGISTHIADAGLFVSMAKGKKVGIGASVALRLFDNW